MCIYNFTVDKILLVNKKDYIENYEEADITQLHDASCWSRGTHHTYLKR